MTTWMSDELDRIAAADELQLASLRHDGVPKSACAAWPPHTFDQVSYRNGAAGTPAPSSGSSPGGVLAL